MTRVASSFPAQEKKITSLMVEGNPLRDRRLTKILEKGRQPIKELLQYLRKQPKTRQSGAGGAGGKKGKKAKGKGREQDSAEDEDDGDSDSD